MMRGRVDFLWEVGPDTAEFLSDRATVEVRSFPGHYAYALMLNSARPVFRPSGVRRALNLAVDRPALVQQGLRGRGLAADGPVWPNYWAHDAARGADPDSTLARLAPRASGGLAARRSQFTCLVPANFAILERMALLVQRQLGDLDIRVRLESLPPDAFNRRLVLGRLRRGDHLGPGRAVGHGVPPPVALSGRHAAVELLGLQERPGRCRARRRARRAPTTRSSARRSGASRRRSRDDPPAVFLAWNETVQAVSRRFVVPADSAGRDAAYVLNRWLLRPPGSAAP